MYFSEASYMCLNETTSNGCCSQAQVAAKVELIGPNLMFEYVTEAPGD